MPKVISGKKYLKRYSEEDLEEAVQAVQNGMAKRKAAVRYKVPRATLQFRLSDKFIRNRHGPTTMLTQEEESKLVDWIINSCRKGFPCRRENLVRSVKDFLDKNNRETQFVNNTPGEGWFKLFMKRHPEITKRTAEAVTSASSKVSECHIRNWFKQIEGYLKENNLFHIFNEPGRIYNGDETNFILCPKNSKVLAPKGQRNVCEIDHAPAKSCVTVLLTFSADGKVTPPMIIFPYKKMRSEIQRSVPSEWGIGLSDSGWMQAETFVQYIKNVFHPALVKENVEFPVIFFVDGHKSHTTLQVSQLCENLGIILIALYPNSTRILQPADVAAFRPIKTLWRKAVLDWRINNLTRPMLKTDVGPILKDLIPKIKPTILINGFRSTGLCPFNPDAVDYRKCLVGQSTSEIQRSINKSSIPLEKEQFQKIIGSDLERNMRNQLIGSTEEAKILHDIFKYFSPIQEENIDFELAEEDNPDTREAVKKGEVTEEATKEDSDHNDIEWIDFDVPGPAVNYTIATELSDCKKKSPSTSRRDVVYVDGNWISINDVPNIIQNLPLPELIDYRNCPPSTSRRDVVYVDGNWISIDDVPNIIQTLPLPEQSNDFINCPPSTSRQYDVNIDSSWLSLTDIPNTFGKESPLKKSISEFLKLPKTHINKNNKIIEQSMSRNFVLTSKEWQDVEVKKQNKKLQEIQQKEEKKKQRQEKAEERRLTKEKKKNEKLKTKENKKSDPKKTIKVLQNVVLKTASTNKSTVIQIDKIKRNEENQNDFNRLKNQNDFNQTRDYTNLVLNVSNNTNYSISKKVELWSSLTDEEFSNMLDLD